MSSLQLLILITCFCPGLVNYWISDFCFSYLIYCFLFFFQAEDGIRDWSVTGVQTCALPIFRGRAGAGLVNEVGGDVYAADDAGAARSQDREIPRAASRIEHAQAGFEGLARHKFPGDIFNGAGDLTEVAGFPGRLLFGFDTFEVWDGGKIERSVQCSGV